MGLLIRDAGELTQALASIEAEEVRRGNEGGFQLRAGCVLLTGGSSRGFRLNGNSHLKFFVSEEREYAAKLSDQRQDA